MSYEQNFTSNACPGNEALQIQPGTCGDTQADGTVHLLGSQCANCKEKMFPARRRCVSCFSDDLSEVELCKGGQVVSHTVVRQAPPGYFGEVPYVLGMVDLDDDLRVLTHLVGKPVESWAAGDRVQSVSMYLPLEQEGASTGTAFAFQSIEEN